MKLLKLRTLLPSLRSKLSRMMLQQQRRTRITRMLLQRRRKRMKRIR
jgi:hypothetical protein